MGQARLKPRAAPQWRFGAGAEIEVEYEGVERPAFVESVVRVHGVDHYDVVIDEFREGTEERRLSGAVRTDSTVGCAR